MEKIQVIVQFESAELIGYQNCEQACGELVIKKRVDGGQLTVIILLTVHAHVTDQQRKQRAFLAEKAVREMLVRNPGVIHRLNTVVDRSNP